jgi:hypothetical protein
LLSSTAVSLEKIAMRITEGPGLRSRFWSRLLGLRLIRNPDLIQVYQVAQQQRITPEEAAIALGILTEKQARELLFQVLGGEVASPWPSAT